MHLSSILSPHHPFQFAYASDGFYVRLVEAVVSFISDYKQLLIIFICASKFFLVLILTAPPPLPLPLLYLRHISWPTAANACPSGLLFLLFSCYTLCCSAIVLFVCLSVCRPVSLSLECMHACMYVYLYACVSVGLLLL